MKKAGEMKDAKLEQPRIVDEVCLHVYEPGKTLSVEIEVETRKFPFKCKSVCLLCTLYVIPMCLFPAIVYIIRSM